jgi:hypothetical protein
MQTMIAETLGLGAMRAATRMTELCESENEAAAVRACTYTLGADAGVTPPAVGATTVNVNVGSTVGYVLDLREPHDTRPLEATFPRPAGPGIDGETVDIT